MSILDGETARGRIRDILRHGRVEYTLHCRQRLVERRAQIEDIVFLLNWGKVEPGQVEGDCEGQVFRVSGMDIDEEPLTAVVKIIDDQRLLIITVF